MRENKPTVKDKRRTQNAPLSCDCVLVLAVCVGGCPWESDSHQSSGTHEGLLGQGMAQGREEAWGVLPQVEHLAHAACEVHESLIHVAAPHHLIGAVEPVGAGLRWGHLRHV